MRRRSPKTFWERLHSERGPCDTSGHGFSPLALGLLLAGGSHDGPWVLGQGAELPHEEGAHREALAVRRVPPVCAARSKLRIRAMPTDCRELRPGARS